MAVPGGSEEVMLDLGIRQASKLSEMAKMLNEQMSEASGDTQKPKTSKAKL